MAGHSHGGQINFPFISDLVLTEGGEKYVKGVYALNESDKLFVTSGIGTTKIDFRLFNIPEIIELNLRY